MLDEIDCSLLRPYWESFDLFEIQDLSSDDASELVPELYVTRLCGQGYCSFVV